MYDHIRFVCYDNRKYVLNFCPKKNHASTPAIHPVSSVARKAVHRPCIPIVDISLMREGIRAANLPTKIPMLAI